SWGRHEQRARDPGRRRRPRPEPRLAPEGRAHHRRAAGRRLRAGGPLGAEIVAEKRKIDIFDTTLRDGSQSPDISFSVDDKLSIAAALDELGVDYIEGGWPALGNTKDQ